MLTYLQFHAVFLLPALGLVALGAHRARAVSVRLRGVDARGLGIVILTTAAFAYTAPWDNYLIARGVWGYGDGAVAAQVGEIPLGEYLFFVIQTVLVALFLYALPVPVSELTRTTAATGGGILAGGVVTIGGWWLATDEPTFYLGMILVWAGPVLALQWGFGWRYLLTHWRTVLPGVGVPTLYLWVIDAYAIQTGIWYLSTRYTTGLVVPGLGLPIEEAVFFLVTTLFVVQGLVLWEWVIRVWR
jgi:lycopene cyclase domain-containing protein